MFKKPRSDFLNETMAKTIKQYIQTIDIEALLQKIGGGLHCTYFGLNILNLVYLYEVYKEYLANAVNLLFFQEYYLFATEKK